MNTEHLTKIDVDWTRAKEIFSDVLEAPESKRREIFERTELHDQRLREVVERLLAAHKIATDFLDEEESEADEDPTPVADEALTRIGPYELREVLGEGGFGRVYRATQTSPITRDVALKLLKRGVDTDQVLRRFQAERDVLARMDHPDIATVFDAGAAPDGRPFVVMELVRGLPIATYAREHDLEIRPCVELMVRVCRAVHHAHQRAVIHRDLKPSNILVTEVDERPEPRIIDFGIARVISESQREQFTRAGDIIGTPKYMSPEQIQGMADADIRTDVYSLGVVLCEILTGAVPRNPETMRSRPLVESPARRPSRLVQRSSTGETGETGETGDIVGSGSHKSLRGDLDRIVLQCVEWDPERRYDSAAALADDLQRYLDGEPVLAVGAGTVYRARKFVARHSLATALIILAAGSLVAGTVLAVASQRRTEDALQLAVAAQSAATRQAARAEFVSEFLLEDMLVASDPSRARALDEPLSVIELLRQAEHHARARLGDDRQSRFEILGRVGSAYLKLRRGSDAIGPLEEAIAIGVELGSDAEADVLGLRVTLADAIQSRDGRIGEAIAVHAELKDLAWNRLGSDHPATIRARLAVLNDGMEPDDALPEIESLLAIEVTDLDLQFELLHRCGRFLRRLKQYELEVQTRRAAYDVASRLFDPDHSLRLSTHSQLAIALASAKRFDESLAVLEELLALPASVVPATHPGRLSTASMAVRLLLQKGDYERSMAIALELEPAVRTESGVASFEYASVVQMLGEVRLASGEDPDAQALLKSVDAMREGLLSGDTSFVGEMLALMAPRLLALDLVDDASDVAGRAVDRLAIDHPMFMDTCVFKARILNAQDLDEEFLMFRRTAVRKLRDAGGDTEAITLLRTNINAIRQPPESPPDASPDSTPEATPQASSDGVDR